MGQTGRSTAARRTQRHIRRMPAIGPNWPATMVTCNLIYLRVRLERRPGRRECAVSAIAARAGLVPSGRSRGKLRPKSPMLRQARRDLRRGRKLHQGDEVIHQAPSIIAAAGLRPRQGPLIFRREDGRLHALLPVFESTHRGRTSK